MDEKERQAVGLMKFSLISPVLNGQVSNVSAYFSELSATPVKMPGLGERRYAEKTFSKWLSDYRRAGFDGLVKGQRSDKGVRRKVNLEMGDAIIETLKANPKLPVTVLYERLIGEGVINPLAVSLQTIYRFVEDLTLSGALIESCEEKESRRFAHEKANELWQADVLYGPTLKVKGKATPTYLHAIIDDCTRYPVWSQFYYVQNFESLRHCLKEAVLRRGAPRLMYTDNGKIYRSQQFEFICASLGCTLIHSRPYIPQGRGKVERFFRTVRMRFLSGLDVKGIAELDALNAQYFKWLEEDYKRKTHSELSGLSPHDALMSQIDNIKLIKDARVVEECFLYRVSRKVQHDATFQLDNILYETDACFSGKRLDVRYDPEWVGDETKKLPLICDGKKVGEAWMVRFHDNAHAKRRFPGNRRNPDTQKDTAQTAISYSDIIGGGDV
jgi:transposase InsO family protein